MIFDVFLYNGEPIAEARIKYLENHVDHFVVVEANETFKGEPKARFIDSAPFKDHPKVTVVPVGRLDAASAWERETAHRNAGAVGLALLGMREHDCVLVSDVDEIPDRDDLEHFADHCKTDDAVAVLLEQDFFYYNFACKKPQKWRNAYFCNGAALQQYTMQAMRGRCPQYVRSGWHLSYAESWQNIKRKIESFSHQEFNSDEFKTEAHLRACINQGKDLFNRPGEDCVETDVLEILNLPAELLQFHKKIVREQAC